MNWKYSTNMEGARAVGIGLPISIKHSIEIANHIRGRSVNQAKMMLGDAIKVNRAIPFKRFVRDMGHKKGDIRTGRYPVKAAKEILELIESAEANARNQGLSVPDLFVAHIAPNKGTNNWKPGRQGRRKSKSTHIEIILKEGAAIKGAKTPKKTKTKEKKKVEVEKKIEEKPKEQTKTEEEVEKGAAPAEKSQ